MIENKELYSFTDAEASFNNEPDEPVGDEPETEAESGFPAKFIACGIISIICLIMLLMITEADSPWANWTRTKLHTAINASPQSTFGYLANSPVFKNIIQNVNQFIRLDEITKLSARQFHFGMLKPPEVFNNAVWPVRGKISQPFGWQEDPASHLRQFNSSVELTTERNATVMAIADGEVVTVKSNQAGSGEVVIDHGDGWNSLYRSIDNIQVESGQMVKAGAIIAQTLTDKVNLEVRHDQQSLDPSTVISN